MEGEMFPNGLILPFSFAYYFYKTNKLEVDNPNLRPQNMLIVSINHWVYIIPSQEIILWNGLAGFENGSLLQIFWLPLNVNIHMSLEHSCWAGREPCFFPSAIVTFVLTASVFAFYDGHDNLGHINPSFLENGHWVLGSVCLAFLHVNPALVLMGGGMPWCILLRKLEHPW